MVAEVQRRAAATPMMMSGGKKLKVGIVGATGAVGEEIVKVSWGKHGLCCCGYQQWR